MSRWFNTAGPCREDLHYMLPPTDRLPNLDRLIAQHSYFVIHAPRQVGKTTAMLALAQRLIESGQYTAALVSAEVGAAFSQDIPNAEIAILNSWQTTLQFWLPSKLQPPDWSNLPIGSRISQAQF